MSAAPTVTLANGVLMPALRYDPTSNPTSDDPTSPPTG